MHYQQVVIGVFAKKVNRFIAEVYVNNELETVHIKNTGRLKEILIPGAMIALETATNPNRKTRYSIIAVKKEDKWINIDSQVPNKIVYDALGAGKIKEFQKVTNIKREATYEGSRFDIAYNQGNTPGFIEIKGVTLEEDGLAMFPDAPTTRGTKHVETLIQARQRGLEASIFFVIQMKGIDRFTPYREMDPLFYNALLRASNEGVRLLAYDCHVSESMITLDDPIPIIL